MKLNALTLRLALATITSLCFINHDALAKKTVKKQDAEKVEAPKENTVKTPVNTVPPTNTAPTTVKADAPPVDPQATDPYLVELNAKDLSGYGAQWWQWIATIPSQQDVLSDITGQFCTQNQFGDVWFLAGSNKTSSVFRKCKIPAGKYIFFPALTTMETEEGIKQTYTCDQLKQRVELIPTHLSELEVIIDQHPIINPKLNLAKTDCFNFYGKIPKKFRVKDNVSAVSDGYWYMLNPLPVGTHTVSFLVTYKHPKDVHTYTTQRITYELLITKPIKRQ